MIRFLSYDILKLTIKKCLTLKYGKDDIMMYPYMELADGTQIVHSHIIEEGGKQKVQVHFERPTDNGFDMARCELPEYKWILREGYSDDEIRFFEELLRNNAHLIYKYAANGGICIA